MYLGGIIFLNGCLPYEAEVSLTSPNLCNPFLMYVELYLPVRNHLIVYNAKRWLANVCDWNIDTNGRYS